MTFCRIFERAFVVSRLLVLSGCVFAVAVGSSYAQTRTSQSGEKSSFRDAKLMSVLAEADASKPSVAVPLNGNTSASQGTRGATWNNPTRSDAKQSESKILSVGAAYAPEAQKKAVSQAQYAEAVPESATAQSLFGVEMDKPYNDSCPDPHDMPSILDIPYKVIPTPGAFPENCPLPDEDFHRKAPTPITFTWKASSLCYKPLYFEDVQLERYGHYCHPLLQPVVSRVRFLVQVPLLPYSMGVNPPCECVYDLGYYRPGNCAPSMLQPIPISLRGGVLEAGAIVGAAFVIP